MRPRRGAPTHSPKTVVALGHRMGALASGASGLQVTLAPVLVRGSRASQDLEKPFAGAARTRTSYSRPARHRSNAPADRYRQATGTALYADRITGRLSPRRLRVRAMRIREHDPRRWWRAYPSGRDLLRGDDPLNRRFSDFLGLRSFQGRKHKLGFSSTIPLVKSGPSFFAMTVAENPSS